MPCNPLFRLAAAIAFVACLSSVGNVRAAGRDTIEVWPGDENIIVQGAAGPTASLQRTFRLRPQLDQVELDFLASDVRSAEHELDRSVVSVQPAGVPRAGWQDYRVIISGRVFPGEYRGTVLVSGGRDGPQRELELTVRARPATGIRLAPETPAISGQRAVTCDWLTRLALGARACPERQVAFLLSDGPLPRPLSQQLFLSEANGGALSDKSVPAYDVDPARKEAFLSFGGKHTVSLPPGKYTGRYVLEFPDLPEPLTVPISIEVKAGAFWPLAAIALGVFLGKVLRSYRGGGQVLANLRARYDEFSASAKKLGSNWQEALQPSLQRADKAIDREAEDAAKSAVGDLDRTVSAAAETATLVLHREARDVSAAAESVRQAILRTDLKAMDEALSTLRTEAAKHPTESFGRAKVLSLGLNGRAETALESAPPGSETPDFGSYIAAGLASAGVKWRAAGRLFMQYLAGPVVWWTVLSGAIWTGFEALYIGGSPTFGARGLTEYAALLAWGFGSKAASDAAAAAVSPAPT